MAGFRARQEVIDRFFFFCLSLFFPVFEAYFLRYFFYSFFVVVVQSFNLDVYFCFLFSALFLFHL